MPASTSGSRISVSAGIDQLGRRTEYGYDAQGRLIEVRQPAVADPLKNGVLTAPLTRYAYDVYGNHVRTTDARNRVTSWAYDEFGQQRTRTPPAAVAALPYPSPRSRAY